MSESRSLGEFGRSSTLLDFEASDPRADERSRRIRLEGGRIVIARRLGGMRMKVTVPARSYRGIVLDLEEGVEGDRFDLRLDHDDPDLNVTLCKTETLDAAIALWADWTEFFDLPRLVATEAGLIKLNARRMRSRTVFDRRVSKTVAARRPRFLMRRKSGAAFPGRSDFGP